LKLTDNQRAERAAKLANSFADDSEAVQVFYEALTEPAREQLLTYLALFDRAFCDALNPVSDSSDSPPQNPLHVHPGSVVIDEDAAK